MAFFLWGVLALGLAGVLVFSSQVEFLVPALAALIVLAVSLVPGLEGNWLVQTVLWLVLSGVGLLVFRDRLKLLKFGPRKAVEDPITGRLALVVEAIGEDGSGRVRFQGTTWKARSVEPIAVGLEVQILGQDGLILLVERRENDLVEEAFKVLESKQRSEEG